MTHLSDLTYLTRAVFVSWTFFWFLQHVWNIDRFEALRWGRVKKHDLKSIITILLVIMCPLQSFYDISSTIIKYQEGYWVNPLNGDIISKPHELWNNDNKKLVVPTNYILCANFSLQTCLLFLLQSFWNYLAKNLAKTSFMGSFEFKSYIIYAIFSIFLFPLLQYIFRNNDLYTEIIPQLAYSISMFLIAMVGIRSHKRFENLLRVTRKSSSSQIGIILKLEYFRDMNRYLTWSLFIGSVSLMILCIDGLTSTKYLNSHKFTSDLLICHLSFSLWVVFVALMLIFYPSSSTISDSVALAKGTSFSGNTKRSLKNNLLEPPTPQWIRSQNAEDSQWSSQISSQQTNSQMDNNNSCSVEIIEELPPPIIPYYERRSTSLDIPQTPPSPYLPYPSNPPSAPPPPIPPITPPKIQQKIMAQPPILSYTTQLTQSPTSSKLKYPSTPLLSRNNSFDNNIVNDDKNPLAANSTPIYSSSANLPIISPVPRKDFVGSFIDSSVKPIPPKKSTRRPSITSNNSAPVIRVTTSTTSLRSTNSVTLPSSDEDDKELSTINKITNLDTRKVAPFMYQNDPIRSPTPSSSTTKAGEKFQQRREESRKPPSKSISQRNIPTEVSLQRGPILGTTKSSQVVVHQNSGAPSKFAKTFSSANNNSASSLSALTPKASPTSKSSLTPNISQTPLTSKMQINTKPYQSSPLSPRSRSGSGMNEIKSSSSSSSVKKSSPAQINNLKNSNVNGSIGSSVDNIANSSRNSIRNSVVRNSIVGGRTRSNSTVSVGIRKNVIGRIRSESTTSNASSTRNSVSKTGGDRPVSSASNSSTSSTSSASSSGSIKKVIKAGIGKVRKNNRGS